MASTDALCEEISKRSNGTLLLGFSRGKDSIAAWLQCLPFFKRIIPFHLCSVPGVKFVDESLAYYEDFFKTKILRFVSHETVSALSSLVYQPIEDEDLIDSANLPEYGMHDIVNNLRIQYDAKHAFCAYGIGMNDSVQRRGWMMDMKGKNERHKSLYPCWDWKCHEIIDIIREHGVKLPNDYLLSNRTMAGIPSERHLLRMEKMMPDEMARIELMFPLIKARLARNEFRKLHLDDTARAALERADEEEPSEGIEDATNT